MSAELIQSTDDSSREEGAEPKGAEPQQSPAIANLESNRQDGPAQTQTESVGSAGMCPRQQDYTLSERAGKLMRALRMPVYCLMSLLFCLAGCALQAHTLSQVETSSAAFPASDKNVAAVTADGQEKADLERLADLWHKRSRESSNSDYPIGPGDVLEISVPAIEELRDRVVRVSGEGTVSLPFIGVVRAAGLSEAALREEIRRQLEAYMYRPQVNLFVREYRSRQVAVLGAVAKPGLYNLASGADTILDMIGLAGGLKEEAAPRILFIPAEPAETEKAKELLSTLPVQLVSRDSPPLLLKRTDPISIELKNFARGAQQIYLTLPVRPGDVIVVPGSGEVLVQGWVDKPGSYKITPGLTVLGAVAAAGGALFPADTTAVNVMRAGKDGGKSLLLVNLEKLKRGEQSDIPVQAGDVIEVSASSAKLVPYGVYRFFSSVFHIGAGVSIY
jgi:polysaccharide biosynthesis/export protein